MGLLRPRPLQSEKGTPQWVTVVLPESHDQTLALRYVFHIRSAAGVTGWFLRVSGSQGVCFCVSMAPSPDIRSRFLE
jgi:hypothetical protein